MLAHNSVERYEMARDLNELRDNHELYLPPREKTSRGEESAVRTVRPPRPRNPKPAADDDDFLTLNLDQDDEAQFLRTEKRVPVRRNVLPKKTAKQIKLALVIAAACAVMGGAALSAYGYGTHSWRFRIDSSDNIEIRGVHNASRAHVMEVAGADIGRNIFFVPLEDRRRQLEQIPWVESAAVMRLLPNHLAVEIKERAPVAFVQIGSKISLIDARGVVMGMPADRKVKYSFPVIRGISETEPLSSRAAAMKIYNRLAQELDSGGEDGARYTRQLSEVDLSDPEDVKVMADEGGGTLLVHLGSQDFLARYKLYLAHVAEWRKQYQNLQSLDLRYEGQVVVNPDEQRESTQQSAVSNQHSRISTQRSAVSNQHVTPAKSLKRGAGATHKKVTKKVRA
ncbi:MAG TPA: FtsQ-type POTRA domain-containing protein [Terriglobales bacterium]|nr:FtsQ-type POTRA domain-containing protein [Terriglobales bacterium]